MGNHAVLSARMKIMPFPGRTKQKTQRKEDLFRNARQTVRVILLRKNGKFPKPRRKKIRKLLRNGKMITCLVLMVWARQEVKNMKITNKFTRVERSEIARKILDNEKK